MSLNSCLSRCFLLVAASSLLPAAFAAGFSAGISPGRFELRGDQGEVVRDTVTVMNPGAEPATYLFKTSDWELDGFGGVDWLEDSLAEDSCRPWVRLERRSVEVGPGAQKKYRFEIHIPDDAPDGLCRFAIIIEPEDPYIVNSPDGRVEMPVVGRFGVLAYVTIGDAEPAISLIGITSAEVNGERVPAVELENTGNTYARPYGQIAATDEDGNRMFFRIRDYPLLPGRTETVAMIPDEDSDDALPTLLSFPLTLDGRIEAGDSDFDIDGTLQ
jgi:fimbrial chaperone protein